jgi:hypothetical protein
MEREPNLMLPTYAMFLLAQFREQAAYPLLTKFFSTPGDLCLDTTGDVVTEYLGRILASVCHNELEPIKRMIEDPAVNEYVRSACLRTLTIPVLEEKLSRDQVIDYFRDLFHGKLARDPDFIWSALVVACCRLYPEELLDDIEYFDAEENRLIEARIVELKRTRALVKNHHDGALWNIPFYHINLHHADVDICGLTGKLDRNSLKVGDKVAFKDRKGNELFGEVIKLNQKTAGVLVGTTRWKVGYRLLSPIIEGEAVRCPLRCRPRDCPPPRG